MGGIGEGVVVIVVSMLCMRLEPVRFSELLLKHAFEVKRSFSFEARLFFSKHAVSFQRLSLMTRQGLFSREGIEHIRHLIKERHLLLHSII